MLIYYVTVAFNLDTPGRALYCGTTKAGGKINFACYRCLLKYQQLIDPNIHAFDYIRSRFDFDNMMNKYSVPKLVIVQHNII